MTSNMNVKIGFVVLLWFCELVRPEAVNDAQVSLCPTDSAPTPEFFSNVPRDLGSAVLFFVLSGVAIAAGLGGGGLFTPLLIVVNGFSKHHATATAQPMLFGVVLCGMLVNLFSRHPIADRPLIDLKVVLMFVPCDMAGALIGVILNEAMPPMILLILLVSIFSYMAYKTLFKGIDTYRSEKKEKEELRLVEMAGRLMEGNEPNSPTTPQISDENAPNESGDTDKFTKEIDPVEQILEADKYYDKKDFLVFFGLEVLVLLVIFAKGGSGLKSFVGVKKCTLSWGLIQAMITLILFGLSAYLARIVIHRSKVRQSLNVPAVKGDVIWDRRSTIKFMIQFFFASIISSVIGIGGGIILIPLLLSKGYLPQVAAATSVSLVAITSFTSAVAFVVSGVAPVYYSLYFGVFCFVGAYIGKRSVDSFVKKYKLASLLIFNLFLLMCCIVGGGIYLGVRDIIADPVWRWPSIPCSTIGGC